MCFEFRVRTNSSDRQEHDPHRLVLLDADHSQAQRVHVRGLTGLLAQEDDSRGTSAPCRRACRGERVLADSGA
ncbi:hypothetical protein AMK33_18080 [Streptomyces sp. CB02400]|nr:hypothetical protein AMK33_18080 [Streptomyces sp. CB02400]